jgi:hypothetical protein
MDAMFKETAATTNVDAEEDAAGTVAEAADQERIGANFNAQEDVAAGAAEFADQEPIGASFDLEDLQDADDDISDAADQDPGGTHVDTENLQDAADDTSEAADQGPGSATKCAYCGMAFERGETRLMIDGRLYHGSFCGHYAKRIAIAAK